MAHMYMDSVKNRGRYKFSSCFNPTVDEDGPPPPPQHPPSDVGDSRLKTKTTARRSLPGFVKAVFFKTPLWKKLRNKRSNRDSHRPSGRLPTKTQNPPKQKKTPSTTSPDPIQEIYSGEDSGRSLIFSSTSSLRASSISSNSSTGSEWARAEPEHLDSSQASTSIRQHAMKLVKISESRGCRGLMFIVLVCLVALVFCGRIFAILTCTSAWLFLAPVLGGPRGRSPDADAAVVDSKEYKKRVVMEGLLERKVRCRVIP